MAAIDDLIAQIDNPELRDKIQQELRKVTKNKKFGLVFERHLPECTPLYDIPVKKGATVAKYGDMNTLYKVLKIRDDIALCMGKNVDGTEEISVDELVTVAEFGEPIYPYLEPLDSVENAPDSGLWHTLIEADNYHALQLLDYLYHGKVDCIYIDPPYNTGAKDWKYNNDYVDSNDQYRHSKWLSMMEKRLLLAKKLLNPKTGVLIVTIDEHEVHHLRTLLEEIFADYYIQMTIDVINPKGVTQGRFSRVEEYNIFCFAKEAFVMDSDDNLLNPPEKKKYPRWKGLLRSGTDAQREDRENMFYPVLIDENTCKVIEAGEPLPLNINPDVKKKINGYSVAWPIRSDGSYGRWSVGSDTLNHLIRKGYVSCGKYDCSRNTWGISYISQPNQVLIEEGKIIITGVDPITNVVKVEYASDENRVIKTVWHRTSHDAGAYGSDLISEIIGEKNTFSFPKSIYAEHDSMASVLRNNKDALVVDFFAGSGTTLNAINLMNYEDNGNRRCILITNNEVDEETENNLLEEKVFPGTEKWCQKGICRNVTWPRTRNSILGYRDDGVKIQKEYYTSNKIYIDTERNIKQIRLSAENLDINSRKDLISLLGKDRLPQSLVTREAKYIISEKYPVSVIFDMTASEEYVENLDEQNHISDFFIFTTDNRKFREIKINIKEKLGPVSVIKQVKLPMADGFPTNANFFKLGFLDKMAVRLGTQLEKLIPVLWMKANAVGKCPTISDDRDYYIFPENRFAILVNESRFNEFKDKIAGEDLDVVYLVTDYEPGYIRMRQELGISTAYQLYRDYLDNFRINQR